VYIAASIDGYIARKDGNIDWLAEVPNPDNSDFGFADFMSDIDAIIMGRITFETVAGFGEWVYQKPVFVLSSSMLQLPAGYEDKAEIINGELNDIIASLHERGLKNLYIDGGRTIQGFIEQDLIDELVLTRIPILLGSGIPLFTETDRELQFEHVKTEVLNNALIKSRYKRTREEQGSGRR